MVHIRIAFLPDPLPPLFPLFLPCGLLLKIFQVSFDYIQEFLPIFNNVNNLNLHHKMCMHIISLQFGW